MVNIAICRLGFEGDLLVLSPPHGLLCRVLDVNMHILAFLKSDFLLFFFFLSKVILSGHCCRHWVEKQGEWGRFLCQPQYTQQKKGGEKEEEREDKERKKSRRRWKADSLVLHCTPIRQPLKDVKLPMVKMEEREEEIHFKNTYLQSSQYSTIGVQFIDKKKPIHIVITEYIKKKKNHISNLIIPSGILFKQKISKRKLILFNLFSSLWT